MGKHHTIPAKARKSSLSSASASAAAAADKRKHGGIGSGNAFDNLTYRSKHQVLQVGKPKGKLKRPAASLSHALAQRQQALLEELGKRERPANAFIDERLAEMDQEVDEEDKLLMRFQKERMKRMGGSMATSSSKKRGFSMGEEDDDQNDEDTMQLTHRGQALSTLSTGNKVQFDEEEEEEEESEGEHKEGEGKIRSKKEVMQEVMLKSKMFRAERAVLAEEQSHRMEELDQEFDTIRNELQWRGREEREKERRENAEALRKAEKAKLSAGAAAGADADADGDLSMMDPTDEFMLEAKHLGLDSRVRPTDRLKSEEELVALEKKRLEKMEKERIKRIKGTVDDGAVDATTAAASFGLGLGGSAAAGEEDESSDDDEPAYRRRRRELKLARRQAALAESASSSSGTTSSAAAAATKNRRMTDDDLDENFLLTGSAITDRTLARAQEEMMEEMISDDEGANRQQLPRQDEDDEEEEDEEDEDEEDAEEGEDDDEEDDGEEGDEAEPSVEDGTKSKSQSSDAKSKDGDGGDDKPGFVEIFIGSSSSKKTTPAATKSKDATATKITTSTKSTPSAATATAVAKHDPDSDPSLPYTFPIPPSSKAFHQMMSEYEPSLHATILRRMRTLYHVSLAPENKAKMEKLLAYSVEEFVRVAKEGNKRANNTSNKTAHPKSSNVVDESSFTSLLSSLDTWTSHLSELAIQPILNSGLGRAFRSVLVRAREEMNGVVPNAHAGIVGKEARGLTAEMLLLAKLVATMFPMSDFRHNVATPTLLLLCEGLSRAPVSGAADLGRGCFACALILHAMSGTILPESAVVSKNSNNPGAAASATANAARFVPEVVVFLHAMLVHAMDAIDGGKASVKPTTKENKGGASTKKKQQQNGSSATPSSTSSSSSSSSSFSPTPTPARLHSSLQPRAVNFIHSPQLAIWTDLLRLDQPAGSTTEKSSTKSKPGKKKKPSANATQESTVSDDPDANLDLHVPLHWIFFNNSSPIFTSTSSASSTSTSTPYPIRLMSLVLQLLHQCIQLWVHLPSAPEIFTPVLDALGHLVSLQRQVLSQNDVDDASAHATPFPASLHALTIHLHSFLSSSLLHSLSLRRPLEFSLAPLALRTHAPLAIGEGYNPTKDYDPQVERAQIKQLQAKLKREKKGALRELRRDAAVEAKQHQQIAAAYAAERESKRREVWAQLEEQQRDTNALQKVSKKKEMQKRDKKKAKK